jgi:2',3'-cyclic-nucleotide 2'-phosphodiesterase (5'-nucleotidase family)
VWIIHTNDSHGRFAGSEAKRGTRFIPHPSSLILPSGPAERLREIRSEFPGSLLLDAGDTVSAGNLGFRAGGEPALDVLSDLGCDAMCLGNRETHPRKEIFPRKVDQARFPLLCANLEAKGNAPNPTQPHVTLERPGVRIGVFGVTVPMFTRKQWSQPLCDYWFSDPIEAARRQAAELRPQVDVLVALTHIGFAKDRALAAACPELDLIVGGHSHTDLTEPEWVGGVPVLQARAFAFYAGIARVELADGRGRLVGWEKRPLRDDVPD